MSMNLIGAAQLAQSLSVHRGKSIWLTVEPEGIMVRGQGGQHYTCEIIGWRELETLSKVDFLGEAVKRVDKAILPGWQAYIERDKGRL